MIIDKIKGYDKISNMLNHGLFIDYTFIKQIIITNFIDIDNIYKKNIKLIIVDGLETNNGIVIDFIHATKFKYPDDVFLQIAGLDFADISKWGWENSRYRAYNFEQDNDFEIICNDIEFNVYESATNYI